ncbi:NAD-dependent epimerase/dehydratase family protein [Streptomyces sp. NPDC056144]|uniref:NAD-dependent epimerase/dehydratase family protein n=1 Tax=unclassified Streptomyces TaxID=2593676 RepID=UPI0035E2C0D5
MILVLGGTGFIGGTVVRELLRPLPGTAPGSTPGSTPGSVRGSDVRVLTRRPLPGWMTEAGVRAVPGDLSDPASLDGCCEGVDTVLHMASYVGRDPAMCALVNDIGTRALAQAAQQAGTERMLYVSTASVYGSGPHRGATEGQLTPHPASAASASRLAAEQTVLERGGVVLRPHLVYGPGDQWFVPLLCRLLRKVPVWAEGGSARTSLVGVRDLARAIAVFASSDDWSADRGSVYHVNHPRPVTLRSVAARLCQGLGIPQPDADLPRSAHLELSTRALPQLSAHQHALLTMDHYYESSRVWNRLSLDPGPGFGAGLASGLPWYRRHLAELRIA